MPPSGGGGAAERRRGERGERGEQDEVPGQLAPTGRRLGRDDPALTLIRLDISSAEVWETDMSLGGKLKMLFGGDIKGSEAGSHAVLETTA